MSQLPIFKTESIGLEGSGFPRPMSPSQSRGPKEQKGSHLIFSTKTLPHINLLVFVLMRPVCMVKNSSISCNHHSDSWPYLSPKSLSLLPLFLLCIENSHFLSCYTRVTNLLPFVPGLVKLESNSHCQIDNINNILFLTYYE